MKFLIILAAVVVCAYGQKGGDRVIEIVRQASDLNADGSYEWSFETENGISSQQRGTLKQVADSKEPGQVSEGGFSYEAPDKQQIVIKYIADENGYQPQGAHIPTPPPTPPAILRALEWILAHPEADESRAGARRP